MRLETKVKDYVTTDGEGTERERDIITSLSMMDIYSIGYFGIVRHSKI